MIKMDFLINSPESLNAMVKYLYRLPIESGSYAAKIVAVRKKRSKDQNAYQWLLFDMIAKEFGTTKESIHDFFSTLFLQVADNVGDHNFIRFKGTSTLSTEEHNEFLEKVRTWCAAEEGMILPLPGEIITDELNFE